MVGGGIGSSPRVGTQTGMQMEPNLSNFCHLLAGPQQAAGVCTGVRGLPGPRALTQPLGEGLGTLAPPLCYSFRSLRCCCWPCW